MPLPRHWVRLVLDKEHAHLAKDALRLTRVRCIDTVRAGDAGSFRDGLPEDDLGLQLVIHEESWEALQLSPD